jgi:signal transduction histidine kinase/ActR/RegA family two-component response regulator
MFTEHCMDATSEKIKALRDQLLTRGLKAAAILGFCTLAGSLSRIWLSGWHPLMYLHIALYGIVLGLAIWGSYLSFTLRAGIIAGVTLALGVGLLVGGGFASFGLLSLFCFCMISAILFGTRAGVISCLICIGIIFGIGVSVYSGKIWFQPSPFLDLNSPILWITAIFAMALSAGIIVVILGALNRQIEELAHTLQKQNEEITEKNRLLENEIAERDRMEEVRRALEGKLQLAQRMESVGKLAGGVAHDLNNTLGSIIGYPELILMDLPIDSQIRKPLETIKKTGMKAAAIVNDMLTLTRNGVTETRVFDLNSVIDEYFKSPEFDQLMVFHPEAQIEIKLDKVPLNVRGSFYHLSKVVMNLVSNAAEAMPQGGKIAISTDRQVVDNKAVAESRIDEGEYAVLRVIDTGVGIPKGDLEKIFEPFYTKKTMGRSGTGLGMTVVWNSIKEHNGHIEVESVEGNGTRFTIYIPLTYEDATAERPVSSYEDSLGRGESILVVDDVPEQREIAVRILSQMGYNVRAVGSGEEAIAYLSHASVDLLILDMIMDPGIDDLETYKKVLEIHPGQKAIITSGFSQTLRIKEALSLGVGAYLKKPYLYSQIGHVVRTELDKKIRNGSGDPGTWN